MATWSDLKNNPRLKKMYETRLEVTKFIREFFWSKEFQETDTPIAVRYPGQEPYLNPVPVKFHDPKGGGCQFYLHTSPEFAMKKLLAAGFPKIFQVVKCFRDSESFGGLHNPEFTMLEWYRAPSSLKEIMEDTEQLFKYVAEKLNFKILRFRNFRIDCEQKWDKMNMREVWRKYVGVELDKYLILEDIKMLVKEQGYPVGPEDVYEDLFYKIFLNEVEPKLGLKRPIFIYDYPAQMCSLSRLCSHDKKYAERFELYIGGLELANAFGELTDAGEQLKRLEEDMEKRRMLGKEIWPVDTELIDALHSGIPGLPGVARGKVVDLLHHSPNEVGTAAGIAMGVDRMVLLFTGAKDLNEVILESMSDQIGY